jgi:hypothetical protein
MRIVERREHDGGWWGRREDGAWLRWNASANDWEGPFPPPWPSTAADPVDPGQLAIPVPTNRLDRWFTRTFPPFSVRRAAFGVLAVAVIGALVELGWQAAGRGASLARYLFVVVAGGAMIAVASLPGMRDLVFDLQRARRRRNEPMTTSPFAVPATFRRDVLVALPFAAVIVAIVVATVDGLDALGSSAAVLTIALSSVLAALLVGLRTSLWALLLASFLGGAVGALAVVILDAMTFSETAGGWLAAGWAIGAVLCFVTLYPAWDGMRRLEARGFHLPMWLVMGGAVLLTAGAAVVFAADAA